MLSDPPVANGRTQPKVPTKSFAGNGGADRYSIASRLGIPPARDWRERAVSIRGRRLTAVPETGASGDETARSRGRPAVQRGRVRFQISSASRILIASARTKAEMERKAFG
jgi:hypothetical protein